MHTSDKSTIKYEIYMFNTLNGASWRSSQLNTDCIAEYDTSAYSISGGILVDSGFIPPKSRETLVGKIDNILKLSGNIAGDTDIISVVITCEKKAPCYVSMNYYEVY